MRCLFESTAIIIGILVLMAEGSESANLGRIFDDDVEILQSDNSGVTLRYTVPEPSFEPFDVADRQYHTLVIPRTGQVRKEGKILIPVKMIPIGMPPKADPVVQVLESVFEQAPFKRLAPFIARPTEKEYEDAFSSFRVKGSSIPGSNPYIASTDIIRGLNIARIAIPAGRYSEASRSLSVLKSVTLRIDFVNARMDIAAGYRNPGAAFERIFSRIVANYDDARDWFSPRSEGLLGTAVAASPFDSSSTWVKIEVMLAGIYRFGWLEFSSVGIDPLSVDPSEIRIFYGGGRELPLANSDPRPELLEIPIDILGGEDGQFDNGDYVVFYADAVDSWEYSEIFDRFEHYRNHYTRKNAYWLTIGGDFANPPLRFTEIDGSPEGSYDLSIDTYTAREHKEEEWVFWTPPPTHSIYNYFDWYWGYQGSYNAAVQLYDVIPGGEALVVVRHKLGSPNLRINGGSPVAPSTYQDFSTYSTDAFSGGLNTLELQSTADFFLDYIDIHYPRWLKLIDGKMSFGQPDAGGTIRYDLTDVSAPYVLLDITDRSFPGRIVGGELDGQNLVFHDTCSVESRRQFFISAVDKMNTPASVMLVEMDNLRDVSLPENSADEIIVTFDDFYEQALRLAEHRRQEYGMRARVAKISDIYNQFSWGLVDAVAVRNFLRYAYENWTEPAPTFALLLGDGHYDYGNNLGSNTPNFILPFENDRRMSDEHYVYFAEGGYLDSDDDGMPDMMIGRIPAYSVQDAEDMIDKTIAYDAEPDLGIWRNRIVVAADDNITPRTNNETFHTNQAEILCGEHVPNRFEVAKIYLVEYPMRTGGEKPEAREALIGAFNQGSLIVDWIGHGSPGLWADEHIFRKAQDITRLVNGRRLPLIFTASCSIGFFDDPFIESFGEELIRNSSRGAVAVISATRPVYASPNMAFNNMVFDLLLGSDSIGMGEAMYMAKYLRRQPTSPNDLHYVLFGDPAQFLQFPKFDIRFTSSPDALVALRADSVSGEIIDNDGNLMSDFDGTVWITVKDGTVLRSVILRDRHNNPLPGPNNTISFYAPGPTIFRGPVDVFNGQFTGRFIIPKDVSYGSQRAKIYVYAEDGSLDATGIVDSILVSGSDSLIQDLNGPNITLFADGRQFASGVTLVHPGFTLTAGILDSSGVNITGQLGHGIVVKIDEGDVFEADVTEYFKYDRNEFVVGSFEYTMPSIPLGEHEISIKAWDNFNNSTMVVKKIEVVTADGLELFEVMNYPNPVRAGDDTTWFQYRLNNAVDRVTIKIFTESGRKIKTIDISSPEFTQVGCPPVPWDLRDADGDELANGVYIYMVTAEMRNVDGGKTKADRTKKLAILK